MAKIAQLLPNRISGHLILEWKTNSYCVAVIGFLSVVPPVYHRAYALSSTTEAFNAECVKLHSIFCRLDYCMDLIDSAINNFLFINVSAGIAERNTDDNNTIRISLPSKDLFLRFSFSSPIFILVYIDCNSKKFFWTLNDV